MGEGNILISSTSNLRINMSFPLKYAQALNPLKYAQTLTPDLIHADLSPHGIAPDLGRALTQIAGENSDAGRFAGGILNSGDTSLLPIFADKLTEDSHPHENLVDWRNAHRGVQIDRAVQGELGKHRVRGSGWEALDIPRSVPLTPSRLLSNWLAGNRTPLSRKKLLSEVHKVVPDANKDDLHLSLMRLHRNQNPEAFTSALEGYHNELANQRLKKLGTDIPDAHKYPDTRPQSKRVYKREGEKVNFSVDPTHSDFHRQLDENDTDTLTPLAYADWLQERGLEGPAEAIRNSVRYKGITESNPAESEAHKRLPPGAFSIFASPVLDKHFFRLAQKSTTVPDRVYHWWGMGDHNTVKGLVKGVTDSGGFSEVHPEDEHLYPTYETHTPEPESKPEQYSRLRSSPEYGHLVNRLQGARANWHNAEPGTPFPSEEFAHAAHYFNKTGDPRGEILTHHADSMEGLKDSDPAHMHVGDTDSNRPLSSHTLLLNDGSTLHLQNHGHYMQPGVHAVSMSWKPKGVEGSFHAHFLPDQARSIADRFLHADPEAGRQIHKALDQGESKGNFNVSRFGKYGEILKFSAVSEEDFHRKLEENPEDNLNSLGYADWLEENGHPAKANLIRETVAQSKDLNHSPANYRPIERLEIDPKLGWRYQILRDGPDFRSVLSHRTPNGMLTWTKLEDQGNKSSLPNLKRSIETEGQDTAHYSAYSKALRFQGYRAPAGGIIVDNTYFAGGSMLPKLTSTPKKFSKGKKGWENLKKKLKGKLIVDYNSEADQSSPN